MKQEILNLANDLELVGDQREAFIAEMEEAIILLPKDGWDEFYTIADEIMEEY